MRRLKQIAAGIAVTALTAGIVSAFAQDDKGKAVHIAAADAKFEEVIPGVSKCELWGDPEKGPYGAFTRFAPGHKNPKHTHSSEIRLVVLEGAYIYSTDDGEKRVEAHEYMLVPAGVAHVSSGDAQKGALFYEKSQGKFDIVPAE